MPTVLLLLALALMVTAVALAACAGGIVPATLTAIAVGWYGPMFMYDTWHACHEQVDRQCTSRH